MYTMLFTYVKLERLLLLLFFSGRNISELHYFYKF